MLKPNPWIGEDIALTSKAFKACSVFRNDYSLKDRLLTIMEAFGADMVWRFFRPPISRLYKTIHKNSWSNLGQNISLCFRSPIFITLYCFEQFVLLIQHRLGVMLYPDHFPSDVRNNILRGGHSFIKAFSFICFWQETLNPCYYVERLLQCCRKS